MYAKSFPPPPLGVGAFTTGQSIAP